jgi:hypothetical protein
VDAEKRGFGGVGQEFGGGFDPAGEDVGRDTDFTDKFRDEEQDGLAKDGTIQKSTVWRSWAATRSRSIRSLPSAVARSPSSAPSRAAVSCVAAAAAARPSA